MDFFDPHFHVWKPPLHDGSILPKVRDQKVYSREDYEKEFENVGTQFRHVGGAFVEAMSVCFPSVAGSELQQSCIEEAKWVLTELPGPKYVCVASAALEADNVAQVLEFFAQESRIVGVRQILNFEPSHPRNGNLGNLLQSESWRAGFEKLAKTNLLFELQCNPSQFDDAIGLLQEFHSTTVVINHLGCPTLEDLRGERYWEGLNRLSKVHENVYIKLSMLCAIDERWDENSFLIACVKRVISIFGKDRSFFASNFPVDVVNGSFEASQLLREFREKISDDPRLFSTNALRVYKK
eukprot:g4572.t1